jgi:transcriptional regulator with XRE-family HTH domain
MPINRDFLHEYAKNPQVQQAARQEEPMPRNKVPSGKKPETINDRIKRVRLELKLSQAKFCKGILLTAGHYAEIELGNRRVNPRMVKLLVTVYGVNETFLRTGRGDMFTQTPDPRIDSVIQIFQELPPHFQDYILRQIEELKKLHKKIPPADL